MTVPAFDTLAIVVVNFASCALLESNLVPLARSVPAAQIVVVDNFTHPRERERLVEMGQREGWAVVLSDANDGFGVGMNRGVERALELGRTAFLLLNPDAEIAADQVGVLLAEALAHPLTLVAPRILRPDGSVWFDGCDLDLNDGRIRALRHRASHPDARVTPWLSGACLLVSAALWSRVGGFGTEYFLYWEDVDLSWRVLQAGGDVRVCAEAVAVHAEGGTQGAGIERTAQGKSNAYYYFNVRNRMLFAARNLTTEDAARWRRHSTRVAWEILLQGGRRQFLSSLRPLASAARGLRDGRKILLGAQGLTKLRAAKRVRD
ncbi:MULTISPECIES: glycosyltransferase family 2 protein [unclassified Cryobacterium]|uniref:glycosyltransferase family 2 protein n=1 Tax=unclassified Cryobacterium TaxID=2649013 RepID=UPI000CE52B8C|nr:MULTISPECIES: glycosyltransferase family 2 protein [unclassified Cryobacterium]